MIINLGVTFLQVTLLVALCIVEYLSGYKAGLAQHLYARKIYYLAHYYQGMPLVLHGVLLVLMTAMVVKRGRRCGRRGLSHIFTYFILCVAFAICFLSPFASELNVYAHVLMTLQLCMVFEFGALMVTTSTA